jgi:hypothetical protein
LVYPRESVKIRGKDLYIQVLHVQRILFDELAPALYIPADVAKKFVEELM